MKKSVLKTLGLLGAFASTMSVVLLIQQGVVEQSLVGPFHTIVIFWDSFVQFVFTKVVPIAPLFERLLAALADLLGWANIPPLYPHWKHVFVLLMTIYGSFTKKTLEEGEYLFGAYAMTVGTFFALLSSLSAGVISGESGGFLPHFMVAEVPAIGFWATIYLVWLPKNRLVGGDLRAFLKRSLVATISLVAGTFLLVQANTTQLIHVGILCLLLFVMAVAVLRVVAGFRASRKENVQFVSHPLTQRGVLIFAGFIGAGIFSILNAGWSLVA